MKFWAFYVNASKIALPMKHPIMLRNVHHSGNTIKKPKQIGFPNVSSSENDVLNAKRKQFGRFFFIWIKVLTRKCTECWVDTNSFSNIACISSRWMKSPSFTNSTDFRFTDGDLGFYGTAVAAFMKQKHRLIWERRHGKIGSGRKDLSAEDNWKSG